MSDRGHELDYVLNTLKKRIEIPLGVQTEITIHKDRTYTITATKQKGMTVQHACIHSNSLIDALWKLIKYIECRIEEWIEKELY